VIEEGASTSTTAPPTADELPRTGSEPNTAVIGAVLIGFGSLVLALRHRRSRQVV
jgi:LPXTG-motif cell wall-anchored protein